MFFLVTGASGVGKSTVRRILASEFADVLDTAELAALGVTPQWELAWRHRMVEEIVQRALAAQAAGRSFLFCGDPVPPGELYAAPSSDQLGPIAVCLLDVSAAAQRERLAGRGDDPALVPSHVAFADWMRGHVIDPGHRPDVITGGGWDRMRWDRWVGRDQASAPWAAEVIDTTCLPPADVAARVAAWIRRGLGSVAHSQWRALNARD